MCELISIILAIIVLIVIIVGSIYEALRTKFYLNRVRVGNQVPQSVVDEFEEECDDDDINFPEQFGSIK